MARRRRGDGPPGGRSRRRPSRRWPSLAAVTAVAGSSAADSAAAGSAAAGRCRERPLPNPAGLAATGAAVAGGAAPHDTSARRGPLEETWDAALTKSSQAVRADRLDLRVLYRAGPIDFRP